MWNVDDVVRAARAGLEGADRQRTHEQAVYGIDSLSEVELHPLLEGGFLRAGLGVRREQPYPGAAGSRARFADRQRCDLVLLKGSDDALLDPVRERLETDKAAGTLFESAVASAAPAGRIDPTEAFWLEVKVVGQFTYTQGVPGPNRAYASELTGSLAVDLAKMGRDCALVWAGLLLVHFTADEAIAEHDLTIAMHRSLDKGVLLRAPVVERFAIPDRIGNCVCSVAVVRCR